MADKILVTGGTGYIGSHTVVELIEAGFEAVIVDNLSNSSADSIDGIEKITGVRPAFEKVDCCGKDALKGVFERHPGIRGAIHFAASKAVGESVQKPLLYYRNNILSLVNLIECLIESGADRLVFSSSCTVYGQPDELPVTENAPIKPATSPYGRTKQICEDIIRDAVHANPGFKGVLLRYFNPIGAHESALIGELPNGVPQNLIPYVTQTAVGVRDRLRIFGDDYDTPDGSCIRDYINISDLAAAHVCACSRLLGDDAAENVETYNIGTGRGTSVFEIVNAFERATGVKLPYEVAPRREGDIVQVWADASKAFDKLGWRPRRSLEQTLRSAYEWELRYRGIKK